MLTYCKSDVKMTIKNLNLGGIKVATIKPRLNIAISPVLKDWFDNQAGAMGISTSGLVVVAMTQYKQQFEALNTMQGLPAVMEELKKIQEKQLLLEKQNNS